MCRADSLCCTAETNMHWEETITPLNILKRERGTIMGGTLERVVFEK